MSAPDGPDDADGPEGTAQPPDADSSRRALTCDDASTSVRRGGPFGSSLKGRRTALTRPGAVRKVLGAQ